MSAEKLIQEYKELVVTFVRQLELERARGNETKVEQIKATSDDDLLRSWLWKFSIIGALLCFLVLPLVFTLLGVIISFLIMEVLWILLKLAMGIVLIALIMAIYITVNKSGSKD